jgi:osmotically-inducible protein OsmY
MRRYEAGGRPAADYSHAMYEDMRRYAGRPSSEDRDYGPYGTLYPPEERERSFEFGPMSRGSGYGGGWYGTGGGYFGTTGGAGFSERGSNFGSRDYGTRMQSGTFGGRASPSWQGGARRYAGTGGGYVGGYRGEDYGGRHDADRGWWDRTSDEVRSWFGDEDAERRRRMDEAHEGEHRGRGPRGYTRSDDRIREDVSDRLTDDPHIDATEIDVTVASGEVTLSGTVEGRWTKRHAEDIAEGVSGVRHVQNNLRVQKQDWQHHTASSSGYTVQPGTTATQASRSTGTTTAGTSGTTSTGSTGTTTGRSSGT